MKKEISAINQNKLTAAESPRCILLGGLLVALAVVFPIVFHAFGLGRAFLPMFYPITLAGFLTPLPVAVTVGLISPIVSSFLTGMPPLFPPIAFIMMAEGAVLSGLPAILYRHLRLNVWLALLAALAGERLVLLGAVLLFSHLLRLPGKVLSAASLLPSLPGVILLFLILPPLVKKLEKKFHSFPWRE